MKMSVTLCTYNGERFLYEQLASIQAQSRRPDEVVICDDASTDRTVVIAREFAASASFPVRIFVNEHTIGSSKNFERAIGLSEGEIIALSDQDDVWVKDKMFVIERLFMEFPDTSVAFSDAEMVDEALQPMGYRLWDAVNFTKRDRCVLDAGQAIKVLLRHNIVTGASMAFRSALRPLVLPIPALSVHDAWIALLAAATGRLRAIPQRLILYRQHGANQIGARRLSLTERLHRPYERAIRDAQGVLQQYEEALERLRLLRGESLAPGLLEDLAEKGEHVRRRIRVIMRDHGWLSLMIVELVRGRYHCYSSGWRSIAHDLATCAFSRRASARDVAD